MTDTDEAKSGADDAGEAKAPRTASRADRREQLIEATIEVLAEHGLSRTKLGEVAARAGVAHGLVNFHFRSKEILLSETLVYLSEEYRQNWTEALARVPAKDPAGQLDALIRADFSPPVFTPARLAAWCAFWGEAQSRPMYQAQCGSNDRAYIELMERICARLAAAGRYGIDARRAARVLRVTVEGTWLDLITMTEPYSRDEAEATVFTCAAAFFPKHFTPRGRRGAPAGPRPMPGGRQGPGGA